MSSASAASASSSGANKTWFPLESNPTVMDTYMSNLGLDITQYSFQDVLSTEDWALEMVPTPVLGVLMVYPIKEASEAYRAEEQSRIERDGQHVSSNVYYMKQTVGNACGTVGLLHCIGNVRSKLNIADGSYLDRFYKKTLEYTPDEIAQFLNDDEEIEQTHEAATMEGSSERQEDVDTHFVCFSCVDGHLYELDGRKTGPINHGECNEDDLLSKAVEVIKGFMARDPEEMRFTIVAFTKRPAEEEG